VPLAHLARDGSDRGVGLGEDEDRPALIQRTTC
jgi:hypothetical protein